MTRTTRIAVVSAGLGVPSSTRILADQLADATASRLRGAGHDVELEVVELRPLAHAIADNLLTGFPTGDLADAVDTVTRADGLIVVTPVFSASYSGLFKSFFDVLETEVLAGKPVLMAATAGTARHSLVLEHALRPLFAYLKASPVPTAVFAAAEDFGSGGLGGQLAARVERAATELVALLGAGGPVTTRRQRPVEDELEDPTPFEELLSRV